MIFDKKRIILALVVIALALFLRLYHINEWTSFNRDQGRDLIFILQHFEAREPILIGPKASVGNFYLGPFYYYLIAPVVWLFPTQPVAPAVMVAFIDSLAAGLLVWLCASFFSLTGGVLAGVLYATSPLAIQFGRFAWNPNPIPFFTLLFLYFGLRYYQTRKTRDYLITSFSFVAAMQLHYQAFILVIPMIFVTLLALNKQTIKQGFFGLLLAVGMYVPFFIYELQHDWFNLKNIQDYFFSVHKNWYQRVGTVDFFVSFIPSFFGRLQGSSLVIGQGLFFSALILSLWMAIQRLKTAALSKKWIRCLTQLNPVELVLLFLLLSLVGLRVYKGDKLDYYMAFLYPVPPLLVGMYYSLISKITRPVIIGITVFILFMNVKHSPLRDPFVKDIENTRQLTQALMSVYPNNLIYMEAREDKNSNPIRYYLKTNQKLAEKPEHGITVTICDTDCLEGVAPVLKQNGVIFIEKKR